MMSFTMCHNTHPSNIVTCCNHCDIANIKLDKASNLGGFEIETNRVANFDSRIRISNCPCIMSHKVRYTPFSELNSFDFSEFVFPFFSGDAVDGKTTFDVVDEAEVFASFVNGDDILEACWVIRVSSNFAIDLY